jgi:N-acetylglucosaminyldiphosphoundecaprenol N-acetyl-beta-D-mannosaminyltransferase
LQRAEFLCADGKSISFASDWLAGKQIERVAGVDLIVDLCARGAGSGLRVYFLGGKPGAGQETAERLQARYKGLSVVGISSPPWGFEHDPQILSKLLAQIAEAKPQIIFVGLGAPKQEMFIDQHLRALHIPVAIGVGGSFEILSGQVQRAPIWMQQTGLEWLFRLLREPRRLWKRYCFGNFHFLWIVFMYYSQARIFALYHRFQRPAPAPGSLHDRK